MVSSSDYENHYDYPVLFVLLVYVSIGDGAAECLGDMLKVNSSLTKLDLFSSGDTWDYICLLKCDWL